MHQTNMLDRMERDIREWDAIQDHRTGSQGDHQTAQWLAECIRSAGAEPNIDSFPFTRRVLHDCFISADGHRAEGVPLYDAGTTGAPGLTAPLRPLGAADNGLGLGTSGPWATPRIQAAREADVLDAIVIRSASDRIAPGLALVNADGFSKPYGPPVLQVATEHG
ncbi:MAG: hypothetical protein O7H39_06785, partial [Gammaproteobacteria bacterium]|nr:hypothetical protein [Gammaproteobacteria bacterium]